MAGFGTLSPGEEAEVPPNILDKIVAGMLSGAASLPRRAIENSQYSLDSGNYDPAAPVEAAMMTMGGTSLGAPARAGETALGAGPVRRSAEPHTATPEFKDWFGGSKVVDKDGSPKVVYHGTESDFSEFKHTNDIGFHFGSTKAANARIGASPAAIRETLRDGGPFEHQQGRSVMPVYLQMENPLRLPDLNDWSPRNVLAELKSRGIITAEQADAVGLVDRATVRDWLKAKGYDGIVYRNSVEGGGRSGDSHIVFDPTQIKSATGNSGQFSRSNPSILGAGAGDKRGAVALPMAELADRSGGSALAEPYHKLLEPSAREQTEARLRAMIDPSGEFKVPPLKRGYNAGVDSPPSPLVQTVADPFRNHFPGIYGNPREIAAEAAARVIPEDPALRRLWGVSRGDLDQIALGRVGNEEPKLHLAKNPKGSLAAQNIQTPQNTQRLIDILGEAGKYPGLAHADAWYVLDPMFQRLEAMHGREEAIKRYRHLNTMGGMASPGSDVMTEIQRGTGAHWLEQQGRFGDFEKHAGTPEEFRGRRQFPQDMRYIVGHPYHRTSQAAPMAKYLEHGSIQSEKPKVPLYVHASGVPETGFQTKGPVGDAHFSRGVGLSDTRRGPTDVQGSFSTPEYQTLQPWWQHEVAGPVGIESVPAQARLWTVLGPQTGVESPLGQGKLELFSRQIMKAAHRLGVSPETARDMVLSGKAGAGVVAAGVMAPAAFGSLSAGADRGM